MPNSFIHLFFHFLPTMHGKQNGGEQWLCVLIKSVLVNSIILFQTTEKCTIVLFTFPFTVQNYYHNDKCNHILFLLASTIYTNCRLFEWSLYSLNLVSFCPKPFGHVHDLNFIFPLCRIWYILIPTKYKPIKPTRHQLFQAPYQNVVVTKQSLPNNLYDYVVYEFYYLHTYLFMIILYTFYPSLMQYTFLSNKPTHLVL